MRDLSLKGVARHFAGISGDFEVVGSIFGVSVIAGTASLRGRLESIARRNFSFEQSECIYGWTAAYQQTWSHVLVRIRLLPAFNILPQTTIEALKPVWQSGIQTAWNNQWACVRNNELPCRISFEVRWVGARPHHTVSVLPGSGQTNMTTWHETDGGSAAAHEFGHMLGNADEYTDSQCPDRSPVNTGTIMDNNSNNIPARLVERVANAIGADMVAP